MVLCFGEAAQKLVLFVVVLLYHPLHPNLQLSELME